MATYNIYYHQFHVFAEGYLPYVTIVETDDIYHEIGKLICNAQQKIKDIQYSEARMPIEDYYKTFARNGYRVIRHNTWIMDNRFFDETQIESPTEPIPIEPKKLAEMLCHAVRQMTEDEGHCDCWVQGVIDASDEEYQYIYNYLPKDAEAE